MAISTHTPLAGRDCGFLNIPSLSFVFLLTRPLRDVTHCNKHFAFAFRISTHTPLAGRDEALSSENAELKISTHTPLAGRDAIIPTVSEDICYFYSHAPCGT